MIGSQMPLQDLFKQPSGDSQSARVRREILRIAFAFSGIALVVGIVIALVGGFNEVKQEREKFSALKCLEGLPPESRQPVYSGCIAIDAHATPCSRAPLVTFDELRNFNPKEYAGWYSSFLELWQLGTPIAIGVALFLFGTIHGFGWIVAGFLEHHPI